MTVNALSTISGPVTGGTIVSITGTKFVVTGEIMVQFANESASVAVPGTYVSDSVITCVTPAYDSSSFVQVRVALNSQQFTLTSLVFQFYGMFSFEIL